MQVIGRRLFGGGSGWLGGFLGVRLACPGDANAERLGGDSPGGCALVLARTGTSSTGSILFFNNLEEAQQCNYGESCAFTGQGHDKYGL